jgi:hypothetical protein
MLSTLAHQPLSWQHCSLAAVSICTLSVVRDYFRKGVLPAPGTVCDIDVEMFPDVSKTTRTLAPADQELFRVGKELSDRFEIPRFAF